MESQQMVYTGLWLFSPTNMNFLEDGLSIKKSDSLTFAYRIIVHAGKLDHAEIQNLYEKWIEN